MEFNPDAPLGLTRRGQEGGWGGGERRRVFCVWQRYTPESTHTDRQTAGGYKRLHVKQELPGGDKVRGEKSCHMFRNNKNAYALSSLRIDKEILLKECILQKTQFQTHIIKRCQKLKGNPCSKRQFQTSTSKGVKSGREILVAGGRETSSFVRERDFLLTSRAQEKDDSIKNILVD